MAVMWGHWRRMLILLSTGPFGATIDAGMSGIMHVGLSLVG
jgi:hypothetical protein